MRYVKPASHKAGLYNWLGTKAKDFVRWWRKFDAFVNQPLPTGRAWYWTWLAPDGYAWFVPLLAFLLVTVIALGCPTFRFIPATIGMFILGLALLLAQHIATWRLPWLQRYLLAGQLAVMGLLIVPILVFADPESYDDHAGPLRLHVGVAIIIILSAALALVWSIALRLFNPVGHNEVAQALPEVELFPPTDRYDYIGTSPFAALISAWLIVPVRFPVELLLPGSLLALFVPDRYLPFVYPAGAVFCWALLFLGLLFERLMEVLRTIGRLFFIGPQFALSLLVILVASARLLDVHYVTYLFNAGSAGYGNVEIMGYLALSYLAAWYYAFWCDQFAARRIIRLLGGGATAGPLFEVHYNYTGKKHVSPINPEGRLIALHGAGRLKLQGEYEEGYDAQGIAYQFQTPSELLASFRQQVEQMPHTRAIVPDPLPTIRDFQRSSRVFPVVTSALAFILLGGPALISFFAIQPPELEIQMVKPRGLDPADLLAYQVEKTNLCPALGPKDARIAVVASGGGTRAAIYTASVLHELAREGKICNVVLVSGVSGGSAALAYFALHEHELRRVGDPDKGNAWKDFSKVMASPFIEDVLERAGDLRTTFGRRSWQTAVCGEGDHDNEQVSGWMPARTRLGGILAESFVCNMGAGVMGDPSFGIMLNTSLLGSFEPTSPTKAASFSLPDFASKYPDKRKGDVAGGRLVLTNLKAPYVATAPDETVMKIVSVDDERLSIARAAALSANFPPVFPDAAIDLLRNGGGQRYWVTDGGAVENRGAMTLYLFIRDALRPLGNSVSLPPLRIIVADVSASAGSYSESFGFNSVLGAGGQLGLGMEGEVFSDIHDIYCAHKSIATRHEIDMPKVLRDAIGTHWLLPGSLTFRETGAKPVTLYSDDVKKMVLALHNEDDPGFDHPGDARKVLQWARDEQNRPANKWERLIQVLSAPSAGDNDCIVNQNKGGAAYQ